MNNTIKRKAWVVYFPQFDKYYPYVGRGSNSYSYELVSVEKAHVFTQLPTVNRVIKIYEDLGHRTNRTPEPPSEVRLCDIGLGDTELRKHPCVPNAVAKFELEVRNTIALSGTPMDHWNYDSSKSVVPDPYNTPLEVQLVEFEINIPVK